MSNGKVRETERERQWRRWLREWRTSGQSVREFCSARGLSEPSFYFWRRRLAEGDGDATSALVPVRVVDEARVLEQSAEALLEVVLDSGRRVRVRPGFDVSTLRQLLAVLEDAPC